MSDAPVEITEQDEADLHQLYTEPDGEEQTFRPILEIWREVLRPAAGELAKTAAPLWGNKMVSSYQELGFADLPELQARISAKITELIEILDAEIASDEDCLTYTSPEEDVANNSGHYKQLLIDWQRAILQWELDWDPTYAAGIEIGAISEVQKMIFSDTGITAFLDNIKFQFDDSDRQDMANALEELKEGR